LYIGTPEAFLFLDGPHRAGVYMEIRALAGLPNGLSAHPRRLACIDACQRVLAKQMPR
jgi:hypothetical protein